MKTHSCLTQKFYFSSSALTTLAALNWVILLLFSPGITHVTAVLWQLFWGQMLAGSLCTCMLVVLVVGGVICLQQSSSGLLMVRQHYRKVIPVYKWLSHLHLNPVYQGLWTKSSHIANPRVNLGRYYANTWVQEASFIGTITVTINHKLWPKYHIIVTVIISLIWYLIYVPSMGLDTSKILFY